MPRTLTVQARVEVPRVPNFLLMTDGQKLPVSAATEDDLRLIGKLWTEALIERAREQRRNLDAPTPTTEAPGE
jgi:electron transfer flavoprotein alpha/beta subunit